MEAILLGTAATETAAATTGLFGSAGAFSLGTAIGTVGTAMSALGAIQSAGAESSAAKYNAAIAEQNAATARAQASANEDAQRRRARQVLGAQRASLAQAGIGMGGSALDIAKQSAVDAELDALNIRYQGELEASGYSNQANLDRTRAKNARSSGYIGAGAKLLSGLGGRIS